MAYERVSDVVEKYLISIGGQQCKICNEWDDKGRFVGPVCNECDEEIEEMIREEAMTNDW